MTESPTDGAAPYPEDNAMPRCCPRHDDWPTLSQHLLVAFPDLSISDIVRELSAAKVAVETAGVDGADALATGELIARHQLALLTGRRSDAARLDPERHERNTRSRDR